jgi:hypothetical protein
MENQQHPYAMQHMARQQDIANALAVQVANAQANGLPMPCLPNSSLTSIGLLMAFEHDVIQKAKEHAVKITGNLPILDPAEPDDAA